MMCEIHGPRASGRHKTLRLRRQVLWCPESLVPCISHITASHDLNLQQGFHNMGLVGKVSILTISQKMAIL